VTPSRKVKDRTSGGGEWREKGEKGASLGVRYSNLQNETWFIDIFSLRKFFRRKKGRGLKKRGDERTAR